MTRRTPAHRARMAAVVEPIVPTIQRLAAAHPGTLSLAQGMVHFRPPAELVQAALAEDTASDAAYGSAFGDGPLLEALADTMTDRYGYAPSVRQRLMVTAGANAAFLEAVLTITSPGDEVVLLEPYYFNHEMAIRIAGAVPVSVPPTDAAALPEAIAAALNDRTRAVVTVSPNNPTGAILPVPVLTAINRLCAERDIYHVSDEAYAELVFTDEPHFAPASLPGAEDHTIALYSLSKSHGFAGWRVGYAVLPEDLLGDARKVQDTNLICVNRMTQRLATTLLTQWHEDRAALLAGIGRQREALRSALVDGWERQPALPEVGGALYLWLDLGADADSDAVSRTLIERFGVATLPGSAFSSSGLTRSQLRVSFGGVTGAQFEEAVARLITGLNALAP